MPLTQFLVRSLKFFSLTSWMRSQSMLFVGSYSKAAEKEKTPYFGARGKKKYSEIEVLLIKWILHVTTRKPHLVFR